MEILYILTLIILGISFMMFKKSDEKLNFIKWLIIYIRIQYFNRDDFRFIKYYITYLVVINN